MKFDSLIKELEVLGGVGLGQSQTGGAGTFTLSAKRPKRGNTVEDIFHVKIRISTSNAKRLLDALDSEL
jgi:hypothetical protein